MKTNLLVLLMLAGGLLLSGCNIYYADQATKRGIEAFDAAKEAKSHGDYQMANDNYRRAQLEFQEAAAQDPKGSDRHYNLARASYGLKEYDRAIREYERALERYPGNGKAHTGKIDCLVQMNAPQKEIDDAVATATTIVAQRGRVYLTLAAAYYRLGRSAEMPPSLAKAVGAAPADANVQATAGRLYRAIGDFDLARKHLRIAYELNPQEPGVARELGVLGERLPPTVGY